MKPKKNNNVRMLVLIGFAVVVFLLLLHSCDEKNRKINTQVKYDFHRVDTAKVSLECELAIKNKDYKFFGIQGYGVDVPGVEREYIRYPRDSNNVRVIEGTSDFITSEEQRRFQELARIYATKYNILLFNYLKTHGMIPKL